MTEYYCKSCEKTLPRLDSCEKPYNIDRMYVCAEYTGKVRAAVYRMKRSRYRYTAEAFWLMMTERIGAEIGDFDFITYVPVQIKRGLLLGGDHSQRIAREISIRAFVPLKRTLRTLKSNTQQKKLKREQRYENARNMFEAVNKEDIIGKNILLVDDVATTGSTLESAAAELLKAGAAHVCAAVFAKTLLK